MLVRVYVVRVVILCTARTIRYVCWVWATFSLFLVRERWLRTSAELKCTLMPQNEVD